MRKKKRKEKPAENVLAYNSQSREDQEKDSAHHSVCHGACWRATQQTCTVLIRLQLFAQPAFCLPISTSRSSTSSDTSGFNHYPFRRDSPSLHRPVVTKQTIEYILIGLLHPTSRTFFRSISRHRTRCFVATAFGLTCLSARLKSSFIPPPSFLPRQVTAWLSLTTKRNIIVHVA